MRVVIDTGVLVSGLIRPAGTTGQVLQAIRDGKITFLYSNETVMEIIDVLGRDKFRLKYHIVPEDISALINLIRLQGEAVIPRYRVADCRDSKDDKFLDVALSGDADYLVSGDLDLISMNPYRSILLITPAEFVAMI